MKHAYKGFGSLQLLLCVATMGFASLVAVPQYESFANHGRISDALAFASHSVQEISYYFMDSGHFPQDGADLSTLRTNERPMPGFVRELTIEPDESGEKIAIRIFMKDGIFENEFGVEQYVYLEGRRSPLADYEIHWRCGTSGIDLNFLPDSCIQ